MNSTARVCNIEGTINEIAMCRASACAGGMMMAGVECTLIPPEASEFIKDRIVQNLFQAILENISQAEFPEPEKQIAGKDRTIREKGQLCNSCITSDL